MKISTADFYNTKSPNTNINTNNKTQKVVGNSRNQNFGSSAIAFNLLDKFFCGLDKNAMIQVSFVDTVSTNIPRTVVDLKTSLAAALETCRREFSGLFINCLMPGLVVKGIAELLPAAAELKGTGAAKSWANQDSIEKLKEVYKNAHKSGVKDTTKEFVKTALTSIKGLEGNTWVDYASKANTEEFKGAVDDVASAISTKGSERNNLLKTAKEKLVKLTKAENVLQFNGKAHSNLEESLRDIADLGNKFNIIKTRTAENLGKTTTELTKEELSTAIDKYSEALTKFVNKKSFIGLGIVLAIAVSAQSINRAITRKQFNAEGAPIYKDFGKKDTAPKMDEKEKKQFFAEKILAGIGMFGIAALSMMKKPNLKMFQFSGIFPTLDQCRCIAASTFASRMVVSEDKNELRENTIRDLASFGGLYFLGDYAKKGAASAFEAISETKLGKKLIGEEVVLLNRKYDPKNLTSKWQKFTNWIKNADLKTANEVSSIKVRNLRNLCRVADIAFSITMLGVLLPQYNRRVTERKVLEAKKQEELNKNTMLKQAAATNTPKIFKNIA